MAIVRWLNLAMWTIDDQWVRLMQLHRPVVLHKSGTEAGVRPIVISTVWHKLTTSATAFALKPLQLPVIERHQLSIGATAGADHMMCQMEAIAREDLEGI